MDFWKTKGFAIGTAILGFVALVFLCRSLLMHAHQFGTATEAVRMTSILVVGLAAIVALMIVLVIVYKDTGLEDPSQALGLPVGSVRALIAFTLLLMFVSLGVFLYQQTSAPQVGKSETNITLEQYKALAAQFVVTIEKSYPPPTTPAKSDPGATSGGAAPDPSPGGGPTATTDYAGKQVKQPAQRTAEGNPPTNGAGRADSQAGGGSSAGRSNADANTQAYPAGTRFDVTFYPGRSKEADDLAKQMFTQLATVLITVVGFYFGSSATSAGVGAGLKAGASAAASTSRPATTPSLATVVGSTLNDCIVGESNARLDLQRATSAVNVLQSTSPPADRYKAIQASVDAAKDQFTQIQTAVSAARAAAERYATLPTDAQNQAAAEELTSQRVMITNLAQAIKQVSVTAQQAVDKTPEIASQA